MPVSSWCCLYQGTKLSATLAWDFQRAYLYRFPLQLQYHHPASLLGINFRHEICAHKKSRRHEIRYSQHSTAQDMQTFCLLLHQRQQQQQRRKSSKVEIPLGREAGHVPVLRSMCWRATSGWKTRRPKTSQLFSTRGRPAGFGAFLLGFQKIPHKCFFLMVEPHNPAYQCVAKDEEIPFL